MENFINIYDNKYLQIQWIQFVSFAVHEIYYKLQITSKLKETELKYIEFCNILILMIKKNIQKTSNLPLSIKKASLIKFTLESAFIERIQYKYKLKKIDKCCR